MYPQQVWVSQHKFLMWGKILCNYLALPSVAPTTTASPSATPTASPLCAFVPERGVANITAPPGFLISSIVFASFGNPKGSCGSFVTSTCNSINSVAVVSSLCIGKKSCAIPATRAQFGGDPCTGVLKSLAVQVALTAYSPG